MEEETQTPIDKETDSWHSFGYAMRQEDVVLFTRMMTEAKIHAKAFENSGHDPPEALLMALLLEQRKMIRKLTDSFKE